MKTNPKLESRNPKDTDKKEKAVLGVLAVYLFGVFFGFRISSFGFGCG